MLRHGCWVRMAPADTHPLTPGWQQQTVDPCHWDHQSAVSNPRVPLAQ